MFIVSASVCSVPESPLPPPFSVPFVFLLRSNTRSIPIMIKLDFFSSNLITAAALTPTPYCTPHQMISDEGNLSGVRFKTRFETAMWIQRRQRGSFMPCCNRVRAGYPKNRTIFRPGAVSGSWFSAGPILVFFGGGFGFGGRGRAGGDFSGLI
jgi:hypothetical protein